MLKKLRTTNLLRKFSHQPKFAILSPINCLVPQELIFLTHFKKSQHELLSLIGVDEILTSHLPSHFHKESSLNKSSISESFFANCNSRFTEIHQKAVEEFEDFKKDKLNAKNNGPENPTEISTEELKSQKKTYPRYTKPFVPVNEKLVAFDQYLHNLINNFHSENSEGNNQLQPLETKLIIDCQMPGSLSKIDFYDFNEGKFSGKVCRMEGQTPVKIIQAVDPSSFKLQDWIRNSLLNRIQHYDSNVSTMKKINSLNSNDLSTIQHTLDSLKTKLDESSPEYVLKDQDDLLQKFRENNFTVVEYEPLPDTYKLISKLSEEEFRYFVENLTRVSQHLKVLATQTGFVQQKYLKEVNFSIEKSGAAVYFNNLVALLISKQVLSSQDVFFLSIEPEFLLRVEFVNQSIKRFSKDYLSSWTHYENKTKLHNVSSDKTAESKQYEEIYEQLKKYYDDGASASKKTLIDKINKLLKTAKLSELVHRSLIEEVNRFSELNEHDSDYQNCKNYLDLILKLPFGKYSQDQTNITKAKKLLEDSHFGMDDVKARILQFLAISKMKGSMINKKILCLLGPPGVGKTSISKSIADCLGRKFVRVALGGENDVSVIKGHRRTYLGAYPGKIINALKMAGTENPVILLDEIDKVSSHGFKGNLQDVLLEILDPSQNHSFYDHYLDMPMDLSKVLFLCSANILDSSTVTPALYDRMEVIELSGYTKFEKEAIFERHLLPKVNKKIGLSGYNVHVNFTKGIIDKMIDEYAREPGVRSLEKNLLKMFEKIAFDFLAKHKDLVLKTDFASEKVKNTEPGFPEKDTENYPIINYDITPAALKEYLGPKVFFSQTIFHKKEELIGFAFGLGFNAYGGSVLSIEVLEVPSVNALQTPNSFPKDFISNIQNIVIANPKEPRDLEVSLPVTLPGQNPVLNTEPFKQEGSLTITGSLGNIMKESVEIAYSFAKLYLYRVTRDNNFLENKNLHIHFPEGASKKDGPSAGITIVTSLISAAIRVPYKPQFAMTGEISLNGRVLRIGGLREKVLAAKREGITNVIVPKGNTEDVEEMKPDVKEGIEFHFVGNYDEVYALIFGDN